MKRIVNRSAKLIQKELKYSAPNYISLPVV